MKAVTFRDSLFRYLFTKLIGSINRKSYYGKLSCVKHEDIKEPELPGEEWVKVLTGFMIVSVRRIQSENP